MTAITPEAAQLLFDESKKESILGCQPVCPYHFAILILEKYAQDWPAGIRSKRPTKKDADKNGNVQWLSPDDGCWRVANSGFVAGQDYAWAHTPAWEESQETIQEKALSHIDDYEDRLREQGSYPTLDLTLIRLAIENGIAKDNEA